MMIMINMQKRVGQIAATLAVGAACAGAAGQCPVSFFFTPFNNSIPGFGTQAGPIAMADFNRDGRPDVAFCNSAAGTVLVQMGNSADWVGYPMGTGPATVVVGDFDGDSNADFATINQTSRDLAIRFGDGSGGFSPPAVRRVGVDPNWLVAKDLNLDGIDDLVVVSRGDDSLYVALRTQARSIPSLVRYAVGGLPERVAAGDFDGDGQVDLVTTNGQTQDLSLLFGAGNGTFEPEVYLPALRYPFHIQVADLNQDGRDEIGFVRNGLALGFYDVVLWQIDGARQLGGESIVSAGWNTAYFTFVDLNQDGTTDISTGSGTFLNQGNGTFSTPVQAAFWPYVVFQDIDADGRIDVTECVFDNLPPRNGAYIRSWINTSFPVTQQPQSTVACPIRPATFSAAASGTPPYTYRWQYRAVDAIPFDPASWIDLTPGTNTVAGPSGPLEFNAAGTDTGTLTVDREAFLGWPASTLIGSFRCIIGSACGDVITQEAVMTTSDRCSCYDFNSDENVDLLDAQQMAQVFVGLITPQPDWLSGDLNADENADLSDAQALAVFVVSGTCGV